jgi:hypothetical protein
MEDKEMIPRNTRWFLFAGYTFEQEMAWKRVREEMRRERLLG